MWWIMSNSLDHLELLNPRPEHFKSIKDLCLRVYPFHKPWNEKQLESHRSYFPDGQLIVYDHNEEKVVGVAFSLIIPWDDYSPQDNWKDFTSGGFFHNHNPKKGKTLYGAEVMVDPEYRGRGIGKMLYQGRRDICDKYGLTRIRAGARLRNLHKFEDKMSAEEYARKVASEELADPTLSFQLNQGFVVIDTAKNYLMDDPESLGYAAVIEWLNPKLAKERDYKRQKEVVNTFMNGERFIPEHLPRELRRLVRRSTLVLGEIIKEREGIDFFRKVENYRKRLKKARTGSKTFLKRMLKDLEKESNENQLKLAHAFALQLELVNACESAYRTWRQQQKPVPQGLKSKVKLNFVLTAHPTESRSKEIIETLSRIVEILLEGLQNNFIFRSSEISSQIRLLWLHPLSKVKTPTVKDEAEYLFSRVFEEDLFDFILEEKPSYEIHLRTWVGGDKDGHPFVNRQVMKECLSLSRERILETLELKLEYLHADVDKLVDAGVIKSSKLVQLEKLLVQLAPLTSVKKGDGTRIRKWHMLFKRYIASAPAFIQKHHEVMLIHQLFEGFPGLVLPIELREDASKIKEALKDKKSTIRLMLEELRLLAGSADITHYARGLVISHCEESQDMENAARLAQLICKTKKLPIIPLFESREALQNSKKIIDEWFEDDGHWELVERHWHNIFEVMLGYSDSSKQFGVLPSRRLIQKTMFRIEKVLKDYGVTPVFFHGSGGSVARGGGSINEQVSWWPNTAIEKPKQTIQGEMVQRLFATPEILNSQCVHLATESQKRKMRRGSIERSKILDRFVQQVENSYRGLIEDSEKLGALLDGSPYRYLEVLKLGSRPAKRPSARADVSGLRAIPWVLCWTQTRVLWPTWWGVGSAWKNLTEEDKNSLKAFYAKSTFFSSFVKTLGYTLSKVELDIWELYHGGKLPLELRDEFKEEFEAAKLFVYDLSGKKRLIAYRPWLEESIRLRSPHIHILNLLQIIAMKKSDEKLLRETLVGIACGMLTTG